MTTDIPQWAPMDILNLTRSLNLEETNTTHKVLSNMQEFTLILLYTMTGAIGLISNVTLIIIILGKPIHRTAKNIYILTLSISGISTALVCIPPTLIQCLYGGKWYLGLTACKLVPAMQGTNILMSSVLVFQTLERISLPWTSYSMCVEVWPHRYMKNAFTILILLIQYLLPLIVLPVVHSQILTFLEVNTCFSSDAKRQEKEKKRNKRMTLVLSCIAVTFLVSSLPLHLFFTMTELGLVTMSDPANYFFTLGLCHVMAMSSCVSNPVLYGWLNTNFRKEILKVKLEFENMRIMQ